MYWLLSVVLCAHKKEIGKMFTKVYSGGGFWVADGPLPRCPSPPRFSVSQTYLTTVITLTDGEIQV